MNRNKITIESLVASDTFQKYCLAPEQSDIQYWEDWLKSNHQEKEIFYQAKELVNSLSLQLADEEIQDEFQSLQSKLNQSAPQKKVSEDRVIIHPTKVKSLQRRSFIFRIAGIFLILVMAFAGWKMWNPVSLQMVTTDFGKTKTLQLQDGSEVMLNANSSIRFAKNWDGKEFREVWLEGEAFFKVAHSDQQKFIVHTEKGKIEVLGTEFNVIQRNVFLEVTLISGKVQLELPNATKINMQPNDQVRINNQTIDQTQIEVKTVIDWKDNKMIFKNASIQNIIHRIENNFGWQVELKNQEILKRKINASIPENNPKLLLEALSEIYDLKIQKIDEQHYVIE